MKFLELFSTQIGSQMWKMNHKNSDIDIGRIDIMDSQSFLLGIKVKGKHKKKNEFNQDVAIQEIGHLIQLLIKGNVNAIWWVMSPLIISQYRYSLNELRQIVAANYSKETYNSVRGLAKHNVYHFIEHGDNESLKYKKKLGIIGRTLMFGINLLIWEKAIFNPVTIKNVEEIDNLLERLNRALEQSKLPEKCNPEPFQNYLIKYRLLKLKLDKLIKNE